MGADGNLTPGPDRALVTAFQAGDRRAFDEIFRRYDARVAGVCYRMLRNPQDAEEAAQETFLKAYQALGRFNGSFQLGAWLARIATNVCVDHLRSKARTNLVALPDEIEDLPTEAGPEEIVAGGVPRLDQAIRQIQPLHANALALRAVEGLSHLEIAGRLAMSPTQVKALLHRARGSLRRAWEKAEGWAVAPLLGMRFLMNERTSDASRIATMAPPATPFLFERVAASAMIVAAALSGLPSSAATEPHDARRQDMAMPRALPEERHGLEWTLAQREPEIAHTTAGEAPPAELTQTAKDLAEDLQRALKEKSPPEQSPDGGNRDEESPLGPHGAEGDRVVEEARKTVKTIQESITP